ncbi:MAG: 2-succinyl-5-enolpyruvyl-6-hydroxy-3-cyclohexene-1-carboxylic-acid synthase [Actinomycetota bacterium]
MTHPNPSTALARVVVDEMANCGVALIVLSPGSRSGALAIAASRHPDVATRVVIDERSAAFHALGAVRATGLPAAVVSTSGSAPANFYPAIVEADTSCVPLIAVSADRPAEMQGIGANQTIDQLEMFGSKVRGFAGIEAPDAAQDLNREWRNTVAGLLATARARPPGPVHLNVRFREPTVPITDDGRTTGDEYPFPTHRLESGHGAEADTPVAIPELSAERGLVIAGDGEYDREALARRAGELGWPVLATALSGMRGDGVITTYHQLLAPGVDSEIRPRTVVAVGSVGPSSRVEDLVAAAETRIRIDLWGRRIDPRRNATHVVAGDVNDLLQGVSGAADAGWSAAWSEADRECRARMEDVLASSDEMSGALVVSTLNDVGWHSLVAASSLPIREVDAHLRRSGRVFANRGASGIDGFASTALGVASYLPRTLALAGDLSLLHDSNGFLHDDSLDLTIVVVDNQGGGLFDSLPQAVHAPDYERLFVTPPNRDLETFARFHGLRYSEARNRETLKTAAGEALERPGIDLIRVPVDRAYDLKMRTQLDRLEE